MKVTRFNSSCQRPDNSLDHACSLFLGITGRVLILTSEADGTADSETLEMTDENQKYKVKGRII
jgi:hypothetical protein